MNALRWILITGLLAAGGYGLHLHGEIHRQAVAGHDTLAARFSSVPAASVDEAAEDRKLRERFALYRKLRMQDDFVALYDLVDPEQRTRIDLRTFLSYYGHGMVRCNDIQLESIEFRWNEREATVHDMTSAELLVEKLPKSYKLSASQTANEASISAPSAVVWVQQADGQWYFRMDAQIAAGKTAEGKGVQAFDRQADDQGGGGPSEEEAR